MYVFSFKSTDTLFTNTGPSSCRGILRMMSNIVAHQRHMNTHTHTHKHTHTHTPTHTHTRAHTHTYTTQPAAGALMQRQRKQETRYFDSGDAFSGTGKKQGTVETMVSEQDTQGPLAVVQGQLDSPSTEDAVRESEEISKQNAEAEEKFRKKFGNMKPSAGALLHRQRKSDTRYFDSGEAFSGVSKKEDPMASEDDTQGPLAVVQGQEQGQLTAADSDAKAAGNEAAEIARKNAEAEAKFKKKYGNVKPSAGAVMHRQRQHQTRYFDSGDAFSGAGKKEDPLETGAKKRETLAVVQGQLDGDGEAASDAAEVARKNKEAEAAFKKKFGNMKPSAGALLHRQRKSDTRYFDSGEAFSGVGKKEDSLASEDDTQGPLAVVKGQ